MLGIILVADHAWSSKGIARRILAAPADASLVATNSTGEGSLHQEASVAAQASAALDGEPSTDLVQPIDRPGPNHRAGAR